MLFEIIDNTMHRLLRQLGLPRDLGSGNGTRMLDRSHDLAFALNLASLSRGDLLHIAFSMSILICGVLPLPILASTSHTDQVIFT